MAAFEQIDVNNSKGVTQGWAGQRMREKMGGQGLETGMQCLCSGIFLPSRYMASLPVSFLFPAPIVSVSPAPAPGSREPD